METLEKEHMYALAQEADFLVTCHGEIETQNSYGRCTKELLAFAALVIAADRKLRGESHGQHCPD